MPKVPRSQWSDDSDLEPTDDLDPDVAFGGSLGHAIRRAWKQLQRVSRRRRQELDDRLPPNRP
jgi:hypothetical protein